MIKVPAGFGMSGLGAQGLGTEAVLEYTDSEYRVVRQGKFVRCGVTGAVIPLEDLRYWSAEHQEAYAGPEAVFQRLRANSSAR